MLLCMTSLLTGRLGLWPIWRIVYLNSIQPVENAASSVHPARASSNPVEQLRPLVLSALTVSIVKW